ncbi:cathepsin CPC1 [Cardiosporidium cionae]|uniref:Cathepsin CPC1 n=1 Tax=Cardiosporidium cionae TaxID=476202 RepID=A0ABQ7JGZ9_9APIC|nr:cathepsin CPC1 [Cardiosporidium cionae]|eukprot:KAF8823015.1 cathepsin CPC1 [Cardiosporidium cionae]
MLTPNKRVGSGANDVIGLRLSNSPSPYNGDDKDFSFPHRERWKTLAVYSLSNPEKVIGSWTPVYDEGWFVDMDKHGKQLQSGCFYAEKSLPEVKSSPIFVSLNGAASSSNDRPYAYYISQEFVENHNKKKTSGWIANQHEDFVKIDPGILSKYFRNRQFGTSELLNSFFQLSGDSTSKEGTLSTTTHACSCTHDQNSKSGIVSLAEDTQIPVKPHIFQETQTILPKDFSWGDPFTDKNFRESKRIPDVPQQGDCGSCYAIATSYVLQHRFNIAAEKLSEKPLNLFPVESSLSPQSILSCSFYNQGCEGGYPFLVAKHAKEIGIPGQHCMNYDANDHVPCQLTKSSTFSAFVEINDKAASSACMQGSRWYARDYGYVGGCYECGGCNGEKNIMEELYHSGPVVAAYDAPRELLAYSDGVFDNEKPNHMRVCDDPMGCSNSLSGWEYTNHAVVIVGWGEGKSPITGENEKYWIVRNSWGSNWGREGYFKLKRGKNIGGIENQVVWVDPDFSRGKGADWIAKTKKS